MTPSPPSISKTSFLSPQGETLGPLSNDCIPLPSRRPVTSSPVSVNLAAVETSRGWNHTVSVLSCPACCPSRASKVRPCSAPGRPYFPRPGAAVRRGPAWPVPPAVGPSHFPRRLTGRDERLRTCQFEPVCTHHPAPRVRGSRCLPVLTYTVACVVISIAAALVGATWYLTAALTYICPLAADVGHLCTAPWPLASLLCTSV